MVFLLLWKFKHINEASGSKNLTFQKSLWFKELDFPKVIILP